VILLDAALLVVNVQRRHTPSVITRYETGPARRPTLRSNTKLTWLGRPISRFSRMTSSKKTRPVTG
jgi:hypothetical protein